MTHIADSLTPLFEKYPTAVLGGELYTTEMPFEELAGHIKRKLLDAADREKLLLEHGEYRLTEEAGLSLLRYQISLPVKGSQSEIKLFVGRILRDIPALSLDGISMQRQNVGETVIAAQIRLSVFFQGNR